MIGDEELTRSPEVANAQATPGHCRTSFLTHPPFQREEAQSVVLQWGAGQELCFVGERSRRFESAQFTRAPAKKWPQPNVI